MESVKWCGDNICRTCLSESVEMKSIFEIMRNDKRTIYQVLDSIGYVNIKIGDKLPKQVCNECETNISKADSFKQQCVESEKILLDILNQSLGDHKISEKTVIKDEISVTINKIVHQPYQCSVCCEKFTDITLLDAHVAIHKEILITKDISDNSYLKCSFNETDINNVPDNRCVDVIKQEKIEYNNTDQDDNDFDNLEILPVTFSKEEEIEEKLHYCTCGAEFNNTDLYKLHLKNCPSKKEKPKNIEKSKNTMALPKVQSGPKREFICEICNTVFDTARLRKMHLRTHKKKDTDDGEYECNMCLRKFTRQSSYTAHLRRHEVCTNTKFICSTCKREFQHQAHLDNHITSVHTRKEGYSCELCGKSFISPENLEVHKERHKVDKKHNCKICNKSFNMPSTLTEHMRTHTGEKPFLCSTCGRGFSQKTNLAQHMRRHQGLKPFKCEECERGFVSKGELVAHKRTHSGAHPFVCDDCGNGFTTSSSLVKHRRVHTGERPYACDLCSMRFAASGTLKNHRRTHTGEKPFHCSYCDKAFVQRQDLVSHIRCHTGERPYVCSVCGQAFRKTSALKAHVKMHGKELQGSITMLHGVNVLLNGMSVNN